MNSNNKDTSRKLLIYNLVSLIIINIINFFSDSIGRYLLEAKIEFLNKDAAYWTAQLIEANKVQTFSLLIGFLNISLIAVAVHHLLKQKS